MTAVVIGRAASQQSKRSPWLSDGLRVCAVCLFDFRSWFCWAVEGEVLCTLIYVSVGSFVDLERLIISRMVIHIRWAPYLREAYVKVTPTACFGAVVVLSYFMHLVWCLMCLL